MARIRTVKPELWTDPEFVECSLSARLLFIAMWNFASDYGVIPNKPRQIKMQCLPADDCEIDVLIEELVSRRFLIRRTAPNGDDVLLIRTFVKNQKINRATLGRWGDPAKWPKDDPPSPPISEPSLSATPRKGRDNSDNTDSSDEAPDPVSQHSEPRDAAPAMMEQRIEAIADAVVTWRISGKPIGDPAAYRAKAVPAVIAEHGNRIRELLEAFPLAPVDSIVHALETGETRNLSMFAADPPPPPPANVVELPARKLNGEERTAAMRNAGAPTRLTGRHPSAPL